MTNLRVRSSLWVGALLFICFSALPALADTETFFNGNSCPGFRFIGGVVTTGPDVDTSDICDFLERGGGITGPGFDLPGGPGGGPEGDCLREGGLWDGHNCARPGSEKFCQLTGGRWINSRCVYTPTCRVCALSAGSWDAFVVRFKHNNVVVLAKRGCVNPKVGSFPAEVKLRKSGAKPYTKEKEPAKQ